MSHNPHLMKQPDRRDPAVSLGCGFRNKANGRGLFIAKRSIDAYQSGMIPAHSWNGPLKPIDDSLDPQGLDMLQSDPLHNAAETEVVGQPGTVIRASLDHSTWLDWNRLVHHPRFEPMIRKLFPDQRKYDRLILPHVVGYLGRAHASRPHQIANISLGGFCMLSDESWTPGTEMPITLQREDWDGDESSLCMTVQAVVVRSRRPEIGFSIALREKDCIGTSETLEDGFRISRRAMQEFLADLQKPKQPRSLPVCYPSQRPLLLSERTQLLLEIARSHRLSMASELWYTKRDQSSVR